MSKDNQAGKGDSPRNLSKKYRDNYDEIDWSEDTINVGFKGYDFIDGKFIIAKKSSREINKNWTTQ